MYHFAIDNSLRMQFWCDFQLWRGRIKIVPFRA